MAFKSKLRQREYHREYYRNNVEKYLAKNRKHKKKKRQWVSEFKQSVGCEICGETCSACLEFHHNEPSKKEANIAMLCNSAASWKRLEAEIKKCTVLCANCHKKLHAGLV